MSKKVFSILSLLVIFAMVLAACGARKAGRPGHSQGLGPGR